MNICNIDLTLWAMNFFSSFGWFIPIFFIMILYTAYKLGTGRYVPAIYLFLFLITLLEMKMKLLELSFGK